jgi:hypothetical protein
MQLCCYIFATQIILLNTSICTSEGENHPQVGPVKLSSRKMGKAEIEKLTSKKNDSEKQIKKRDENRKI